jgi:hypothetical protein
LKEVRKRLHTIIRRRNNWTGDILSKNCLLKHCIEGKIEQKRRKECRRPEKRGRGIRRKQLLYGFKEKDR